MTKRCFQYHLPNLFILSFVRYCRVLYPLNFPCHFSTSLSFQDNHFYFRHSIVPFDFVFTFFSNSTKPSSSTSISHLNSETCLYEDTQWLTQTCHICDSNLSTCSQHSAFGLCEDMHMELPFYAPSVTRCYLHVVSQ